MVSNARGFGNLISAVVLSHTGWNSRAEVGAAAAIMLLAGVAGLWLVKRTAVGCARSTSRYRCSSSQRQTSKATSSRRILAHGPLPDSLSDNVCAVTHGRLTRLERVLLAVINFLAVNSGFTNLLGGITPIVLVLFACQAELHGRDRAIYVTAFVASIATVALFAHGSHLDGFGIVLPVPLRITRGSTSPLRGGCIARPINPKIGFLPGEPVGTVAAVAAVTFTCYAVYRALRSRGRLAALERGERPDGVHAGLCVHHRPRAGVSRTGTADCVTVTSSTWCPGCCRFTWFSAAACSQGRRQVVALGLFVSLCFLKESSARSRREAAHESGSNVRGTTAISPFTTSDQCNASAGRPFYPSAGGDGAATRSSTGLKLAATTCFRIGGNQSRAGRTSRSELPAMVATYCLPST